MKSFDKEVEDMRFHIHYSTEPYPILDYIIRYADEEHKQKLFTKYCNEVENNGIDRHLFKNGNEACEKHSALIQMYYLQSEKIKKKI